jgi:hypothetical protein
MGGTIMAALYTVPGSRCPVFIGGIEYGSIYGAALETGISAIWLTKSIKKNSGGPVVVKNQFVVTRLWVDRRVPA